MITISEYGKAMAEVFKYNQSKKEVEEKYRIKLRKIDNDFQKQKRELENKRASAASYLEEIKETAIGVLDTLLKDPLRIRTEHNHIMNLFISIQTNKKIVKPEIYKYSGLRSNKKTYHPIETIINDEYKNIYIYITDNNKPKNCFSLIIVGDTIFNEKLTSQIKPRLYDYGISADSTSYTPIKLLIKDASSEKILKDYLSKNKEKILKEILEGLETLEKEYREAVKLYNDPNWRLSFLKYQKHYYETGYHRGTETKEYKAIMEEIKTLTKK